MSKEKDMAIKELESYEDVFADIVNVLLFEGREIILPEELHDAEPRSQYSGFGAMQEQRQDVAKYWKEAVIRLARFSFENETYQNPDMVLRIISYDGGAYRQQLLRHKSTEEPVARYPCISLVLYFGYKHRWKQAVRLKDRLTIAPELEPYVNDYKMYLFEIAFLEREVIDRFKSDFWYVADMFWQMRHNRNYVVSREQMQHSYAVMRLLAAVSGDVRIEESLMNNIRKEGATMSGEIYEFLTAKGREEGRAEGHAEGRTEGSREILQSLWKEGLLSLDIAAQKANMTREQFQKFSV